MLLRSLLIGSLLLGQSLAQAADTLAVTGVWSRAMPTNATNGAAYFVISNTGAQPDRLLSAYSDRAERTELHTHVHTQDGLMRMQPVETIEIPAGETLAFKPGSYHVMLLGLKQPLKAGEHLNLSLTFEKQGQLQLEVPIQEQAPVQP